MNMAKKLRYSNLMGVEKKIKKVEGRDYASFIIALKEDQIIRPNDINKKIYNNRSELIQFAIDESIKWFDNGDIRAVTETKTVTVPKSD